MSQQKSRDVMGYDPPKGPTNINDPARPGIQNGDNCGKSGVQGGGMGRPQTSGSPGLGGTNHGSSGTQGRR